MIYLALKKTPAKDAGIFARAGAWLIKARLVSHYCHGGIIDGSVLTHATPAYGLHATEYFDNNAWDLFPFNLDAQLLEQRFIAVDSDKYDWFSLLAFVGIKSSDSKRMYCFEWCYYAMTGERSKMRVTPEILLALALAKKVST